VRLASVHHTPLALPGHEVRAVVLPGDLRALGRGDVVIWGEPSEPLLQPGHLQGTGAVVLALDPGAVHAARQCGLTAYLLPDLSPEVLLRALEPDALAAVEAGTLLREPPTLWTEGRATPLPPHEAVVLGALLEGPARREALHQRLGLAPAATSRAADALIARLRRRLGRRHIVRARSGGWQLVLLSQARPAPLPAGPAPIDLGPVKVDLAQRLAWDGQRQIALTRLDVALLDALVSSSGPVAREILAHRAWGRPVDRESIDLAIHRLRRKLGHDLVLTVRGHGYQLRRAGGPEPSDLAVTLAELLREPQLVALIGPPGVGKSAVAARVAERLRCPRLDLHGADRPAVQRALRRHGGSEPLVLDGLEAEGVELPQGRPVLITGALAPPGARRVLRMEPWGEEALGRAFPGASAAELAAADGLPGSLADPTSLRARLALDPARPALARLSCFAGSFSPADAALLLEPGAGEQEPALEALLARSWLERAADGRLRLLRPVREAVASAAGPAEALRWARLVVGRVADELEARPFEPGPVQQRLQDLISACARLEALDPPAAARAAQLRLDVEQLVGTAATDRAALSRAIALADDPWLRAELVRGLARALRRARDPDAALIAYTEAAHTGSVSTACRAWLGAAAVLSSTRRHDEAWAALELAERLLPALEDPVCRVSALDRRAEMSIEAGQLEEAVGAAVEGLTLLERERWIAGSPLEADGWRALWAEAGLRDTLGHALSHQRRYEAAAASYRRALDLYTRLGALWPALSVRPNLATVCSRMGRLEEASALDQETLALAQALGATEIELVALVHRASAQIQALRPADALPLLDQIEARAAEGGYELFVSHAAFLRVLAAAASGQAAAVEASEPALQARLSDPPPARRAAGRAGARPAPDRSQLDRAHDAVAALGAFGPEVASALRGLLGQLGR
jgi:tetratricopeptide (TPR) repeat protein